MAELAGESEGVLNAALCSWELWGRPEQQEPEVPYTVWVLKAGRGWGKNRTASEWVHRRAWKQPGSHGALVARAAADVRDTVVSGVSGILATQKPWNRCEYFSSTRQIRWENGTVAHTYSSEEPDQLRGPNHHWALADEFATWTRKMAADGGTAWDNLRLGLRLRLGGLGPQMVVATTPRPTKEMKALLREPGVTVTNGRQLDNAKNLAPEYLEQMKAKYAGTRLGRQELEGELLEDVEGSIVTLAMIDDMRMQRAPGDLTRVVIGVDPSGGAEEQGIVAAGRLDACPCGMGGPLPHFWVCQDASGHHTPEGWASTTVRLYHGLKADRVLGERNYGGDLVESNVRQADPEVSYEDVVASRGKAIRAEPVLALYEQLRVHHVGDELKQLEDELRNFTPEGYMGGGSPNRADALVWALTHLSPRYRKREFHVW